MRRAWVLGNWVRGNLLGGGRQGLRWKGVGGGPGASIALKARGLAGAVEWPFTGYALMGSGLELFSGVRGAWVGARVGGVLARIFCAGPGGSVKAVGTMGFVWATQVGNCGENFPVFVSFGFGVSFENVEEVVAAHAYTRGVVFGLGSELLESGF